MTTPMQRGLRPRASTRQDVSGRSLGARSPQARELAPARLRRVVLLASGLLLLVLRAGGGAPAAGQLLAGEGRVASAAAGAGPVDALFALNEGLPPRLCAALASLPERALAKASNQVPSQALHQALHQARDPLPDQAPACRALAASLPPAQALAVGDVDGDGHADIATAGEGPVTLCLSAGEGGPRCDFVDAGAGRSTGIALGDADGDGRVDIALSRVFGPDRLCLGQGGWRFRCLLLDSAVAPGVDMPSQGLAMADLDGDGRDEIAIAQDRYEDETSRLCEMEDGTPTCRSLTDTGPSTGDGVAIGDVDGDGALDVVFGGGPSGMHDLCRGDGTGSLVCAQAAGVPRGGLGPALGDLDGDGAMELLFVGSDARACRAQGPSPLQFHCFAFLEGYGGLAVAAADLDADGHVDLVTAGPERLCLGDGRGGFACREIPTGVEARGRAIALADLAAWRSEAPAVQPTPRWTSTPPPSPTPTLASGGTPTARATPTSRATPSATGTASAGPSPTPTPSATPTATPDRGADLRLDFAGRLDLDLPLGHLDREGDRGLALGSDCHTFQDPEGVRCESMLVELDLSDPGAPRELGRHELGRADEEAVALAVDGAQLYVAYQRRGPSGWTGARLALYRLPRGGALDELSSYELSGNREHLALAAAGGRVAWSHAAPDLPEQGEVRILTVASSSSPTRFLEAARLPLRADGLGLGEGPSGPRLYLSRSDDAPWRGQQGLWTYELLDPSAPRPLDVVEGMFGAVLADGPRVIVERHGIRLCGDTDPRVPAWPCGTGIEEVDLTRPERPRIAWDWREMRLDAAALAGDGVLLVALGDRLRVFDRGDADWPLRRERVLLERGPGEERQLHAEDLAFAPRPASAADDGLLGHAYALLREGGPAGERSQLRVLALHEGRRLFLPAARR